MMDDEFYTEDMFGLSKLVVTREVERVGVNRKVASSILPSVPSSWHLTLTAPDELAVALRG